MAYMEMGKGEAAGTAMTVMMVEMRRRDAGWRKAERMERRRVKLKLCSRVWMKLPTLEK